MVLDSGRYKAELFSYLTLAMPLAMRAERFDDIRYGTRDDDSLHYIYMKKRDSLTIVIGIDPIDHFIKSSEGVIQQEDASFVFINWLSDFQQTDGYWFPHALTNISMGLKVATSVLVNVEINPGLKDSEFAPGELFDLREVH
jgi:hypothetical protein